MMRRIVKGHVQSKVKNHVVREKMSENELVYHTQGLVHRIDGAGRSRLLSGKQCRNYYFVNGISHLKFKDNDEKFWNWYLQNWEIYRDQ